jgi:AraC-like DNA-binding protein
MSALPTHSFPASHALQLVTLVRRWNVAAEELLDGLALTEAELEAPHARISVELLCAISERARTLTAEPGIGFYLGMQKRLAMYGYLGFATMSAATLREAIELAVRYAPTVSTAISFALHVAGDTATIVIEEHVDLGSTHDIGVFSLLVGMRQLTSVMIDQRADERLIKRQFGQIVSDIPLAKPAYFERFAHLLPGVRFEQPELRIQFDAAALAIPLIAPDRAALRLARDTCERQLAELGFERQLPTRVGRLAIGPEGPRTIDQIAHMLHVSARTLKRKLAAEGVTFSALIDRERHERALGLLRSSELTLEVVAQRLHYSSMANFARAFRRWAGETPAQHRRRQRAGR